MRKIATVLVILGLCLGLGAETAPGGGLTTMLAGQPALAEDVNLNNKKLVDMIIALDARLDALEAPAVTLGNPVVTGGSAVAGKSGYLDLEGGMILQWGTVNASSNSHGTTTSITFLKPFPNALLYANATPAFAVNVFSGFYTRLDISAKTQVTFQRWNNTNSDAGVQFTWFAIGN